MFINSNILFKLFSNKKFLAKYKKQYKIRLQKTFIRHDDCFSSTIPSNLVYPKQKHPSLKS